MVAVPVVGWSSPRIIRMVVVLPAPLGPRNPVTTPGSMVQVRLSTARVSPNTLVSPANSIIAPIVSAPLLDDQAGPRAHARRIRVCGEGTAGDGQAVSGRLRRPRVGRPRVVRAA